MAKVLIYGEIKAGKIKKTAFELASEGRKLADGLGGDLGGTRAGVQRAARGPGPHHGRRVAEPAPAPAAHAPSRLPPLPRAAGGLSRGDGGPGDLPAGSLGR